MKSRWIAPVAALDQHLFGPFCLDQLYRSRERRLKDPVTPDMALTFEELIGALLLARDEIMIQDYEH
jgi:hypothetical protein